MKIMVYIITVVAVTFFVSLFTRNDVSPNYPCSWYANTFIATTPVRCLNYWEHHGTK